MNTIFFISFLTTLALHVSSAIRTHHQEHNCSVVIGFCICGKQWFSNKWCGGLFYMDLCVFIFQRLM
jgi:hypothetical protein